MQKRQYAGNQYRASAEAGKEHHRDAKDDKGYHAAGYTADSPTGPYVDLRKAGCDFLTIGQYLAPSTDHLPVAEYVSPERFKAYEAAAYEKDFSFVASGPFVRSSYKAADMLSAF